MDYLAKSTSGIFFVPMTDATSGIPVTLNGLVIACCWSNVDPNVNQRMRKADHDTRHYNKFG